MLVHLVLEGVNDVVNSQFAAVAVNEVLQLLRYLLVILVVYPLNHRTKYAFKVLSNFPKPLRKVVEHLILYLTGIKVSPSFDPLYLCLKLCQSFSFLQVET